MSSNENVKSEGEIQEYVQKYERRNRITVKILNLKDMVVGCKRSPRLPYVLSLEKLGLMHHWAISR